MRLFRITKKSTKDENGGATVEFVLWVPIYMLILALVIDASLAFLSHANMWTVARDTARRVSVRELSAAEAVTYASDKLSFLNGTATVSASDTGPDVWVNITASPSEVTPFGIFAFVASDTMTARVTQSLEPF